MPSPVAGPPLRAPADNILSDQEAGLRRTAGTDHLGLAQAAEQEENQPLALTRFRSWGWVEEATRSWAGGGSRADEVLLLLTRVEGARLAYEDFRADAVTPPLQAAACPALIRADECIEGRAGALSAIAARVGSHVFRFRGTNTDLERLAALQAARIRLP